MYPALSRGILAPHDLLRKRNVAPKRRVPNVRLRVQPHNILERRRVVAPAVVGTATKVCNDNEVVTFMLAEDFSASASEASTCITKSVENLGSVAQVPS